VFEPGPTVSALYPEVAAGGFTRLDGTVEFYTRVNALIDEDSRILDFGAGRGWWEHETVPVTHHRLRRFRGRVKEVVGVDVDDAILDNPGLDSAHIIALDPLVLPLPDGHFDLVLADYVLEHVAQEDVKTVVDEIGRVLKPGGWFVARTPNKWGLIGLGARVVPNRLHTRVLAYLQPGRKAEDVFPTRYAMNTKRALRRHFPEPSWHVYAYGWNSEPRYVGTSKLAWRVAGFLDRITPPALAGTLMIFIQKAD
jgi:SAM-dependent methyltransferase